MATIGGGIMEYLFIYLLDFIGKLGIISGLVGFGLIVLIPAYIAVKSGSQDPNDVYQKLCEYWAHKIEITLVLCGVVLVATFILPTKQTLLLMGGTYLGKKAVNQVVTSQKLEKVNTII